METMLLLVKPGLGVENLHFLQRFGVGMLLAGSGWAGSGVTPALLCPWQDGPGGGDV